MEKTKDPQMTIKKNNNDNDGDGDYDNEDEEEEEESHALKLKKNILFFSQTQPQRHTTRTTLLRLLYEVST